MRAGPALLVAGAVTAASLLASSRAGADTPPGPPPGPVAPAAAPLVPPMLERRSTAAMTGGLAGVAIGGVLLVSSAFAGTLQASCDGGCHHQTTVIGLVAAGSALIAAGIPLIVWGARLVPVAGPAPGVALVPRRPLPAWAGGPGSEGWGFRF